MRTRHLVTLGICFGGVAATAAFVGCGESLSGTCEDTLSCTGEGGTSEGGGSDSPSGNETGTQGDGGDSGKEGSASGDAGDGATQETGVSCDAASAIVCSGTCVDKETDPNNCNTCNHVCPGPDSGSGAGICVNGACQISCASDAGTTLLCPDGVCVDPTTIANCGVCGNICPPPTANGSASCVGSPLTCGISCTSGYHGSGTACTATCALNSDDPTTDPCVVADGLGVFVSPYGHDTTPGDGSKEHPFATIANAMTQAVAASKRVYACGTFTSPVAVAASMDGVTVYGGFDCTTWAYSASTPTQVAPTGQGYALQVTGTTTGVTFNDFAFTAVDAPSALSATPVSSIAVFANAAVVTFNRVAVAAGQGQPGEGGGTAQNYSAATAPGGKAPSSLAGGAAGGPNNCQDGSTSSGGKGADVGGFASPGSPISLPSNAGTSGMGGCTPGGSGTPGVPASGVGLGVTSSGTVSASGWTLGGAGGNGNAGGIGQGGGGGGSNSGGNPGAGGGGGAGGCGGGAGTGGVTGGSSIGILSFQSTVVAMTTLITTQLGGAGGGGGTGQTGQAGGGVGGGGGGDGTGGGGGAGGLSAGIVWSGTTGPSFNGTTYTTQATVTGITLGVQGTGGGNGATPTSNAVFEN